MLHGYNDRYHKDDILKHINMLDIPGESTLNYLLGPDCNEKDENGNEWTKESFFSKYIPNNFLKSRSKLLLGLRDGLSIGGSSDPSEDCLEQGCGLTISSHYSLLKLLNISTLPSLTLVWKICCLCSNQNSAKEVSDY